MLKIEESKIVKKCSQSSRLPCTQISKVLCQLHTFILSCTPYIQFSHDKKSSLTATLRALLLNISLELLKRDTTCKHFLSSVENLAGFDK